MNWMEPTSTASLRSVLFQAMIARGIHFTQWWGNGGLLMGGWVRSEYTPVFLQGGEYCHCMLQWQKITYLRCVLFQALIARGLGSIPQRGDCWLLMGRWVRGEYTISWGHTSSLMAGYDTPPNYGGVFWGRGGIICWHGVSLYCWILVIVTNWQWYVDL